MTGIARDALRSVREVVRRVTGRTLAFPVRLLVQRSARSLGVALIYHRVDHSAGKRGHELLPALSASSFEGHLRYLRRHFRLVPASDLIGAARERRRGERIPVAITFDDDARCDLTVAAPILRSHGAPATFFLTGTSLDEPFSFWWDRLQRAVDGGLQGLTLLEPRTGGAPLTVPDARGIRDIGRAIEGLSPDDRRRVSARLGEHLGPDPADAGLRASEVRRLTELGFEVGFHTRGHDPLPALDDQALKRAMAEGRDELEQAAGRPMDMISYPHGRADARVASAARAAGYRHGFVVTGRAAPATADPLLVDRLSPTSPSAGGLALQLARALLAGSRSLARSSAPA